MRSDLPDRDSDKVRAIVEVAPDPPVTAFGAVFDRWVRGDLRSRDEMDESGLYWLYRNLGYTEDQANHRAKQTLDAAWGGDR